MLLQQQMIQAQMMEPMQIQLNNNRNKIKIAFKDTRGRKTTLFVDIDITIKELIDNYMKKEYGYENIDLTFTFNTKKINSNSQIKIKEFFEIYFDQNPVIMINKKNQKYKYI